MAVSDKTRKLLWAKSGNRCAYCRCELHIQHSASSAHVVVGEECHVSSRRPTGSRYDANLSDEFRDSYDNLILLCSKHHKLIDDDPKSFPAEQVLEMKRRHQDWVEACLKFTAKLPAAPERKERRLSHLVRVQNGGALCTLLVGAKTMDLGNDEPEDQEEVVIIGSFLQMCQDYADIFEDLRAEDRIRAEFEITQEIKRLAESGFWVFAGQERRNLRFGENILNWDIAVLRVLRSTNPLIMSVDLTETKSAVTEGSKK